MEIIEEEGNRYGICPRCGHKINLCGAGYMGLFECDCGQWYNIFGQALKPPEDWYEYHYDYSDEDEDWESEWRWYETLYKWSINAL